MTDQDDLKRVGEEIGRALFGSGQPKPTASAPDTEPDDDLSELDDDRQEAARRHGLPPELAKRIEGESWDEINADAKKLATLVKKPEPVSEHERLTQRAHEIARSDHPNRGLLEVLYLQRAKTVEHARQLFGGQPGQPPVELDESDRGDAT